GQHHRRATLCAPKRNRPDAIPVCRPLENFSLCPTARGPPFYLCGSQYRACFGGAWRHRRRVCWSKGRTRLLDCSDELQSRRRRYLCCTFAAGHYGYRPQLFITVFATKNRVLETRQQQHSDMNWLAGLRGFEVRRETGKE